MARAVPGTKHATYYITGKRGERIRRCREINVAKFPDGGAAAIFTAGRRARVSFSPLIPALTQLSPGRRLAAAHRLTVAARSQFNYARIAPGPPAVIAIIHRRICPLETARRLLGKSKLGRPGKFNNNV